MGNFFYSGQKLRYSYSDFVYHTENIHQEKKMLKIF